MKLDLDNAKILKFLTLKPHQEERAQMAIWWLLSAIQLADSDDPDMRALAVRHAQVVVERIGWMMERDSD